ncbi:MAG: hypothetical protein QM689_01220 [Oscillospiraceae bacterium]
MRRILAVLALSLLIITAGCGKTELPAVDGQALIEQARAQYTALDSAQVVTTDLSDNHIAQSFTFKYDEVGMLIYSYTIAADGEVRAEYNNGFLCEVLENGVYTVTEKGMADFSAYNRAYPHRMAGAGLIAFDRAAVLTSSLKTEGEVTTVTVTFDPSKIGLDAMAYAMVYRFSADGTLIDFTSATVTKTDAGEKTLAFRTEIKQRNGVTAVENPVKPPETPASAQ